VLRPFIARELLMARVDEARKIFGVNLTVRMVELGKELDALIFPNENDLRP
jgi:hypothetical protein